LGEGPFHDPAVFQYIGNSRRAAQIVFKDVNLSVPVADQVGAGDVAPDALRGIETDASFSERMRGANQIFGNDLIFDDFLLVINVVDEKIEGVDSLLEPLFDLIPF